MLRTRSALAIGFAWVGLTAGALSQSLPASPAPAGPPAPVSIDIVVLGVDGRPVDTLGRPDFSVVVDGKPRSLAGVRHVSRGPGATDAAAQVAARADSIVVAAESARTVLLVVDETLMERGDAASTVRAATTVLDRLGLSDRVAIVRLPMRTRMAITLTTDRPSARDDLRSVVGQIALPADADAAQRNDAARADLDSQRTATAVADPDKAGAEQREQMQEEVLRVEPSAALSPESAAAIRDSVGGLRDILVSLRSVPGRKAVVLFSPGLPRGWNDVIRENELRMLAATAIAARTTLHAFGLKTSRSDARAADATAFDRLARMTGGFSNAVDKQMDRAVDRLMASMSSSYVLSWQPVAGDADGRPHSLRVESSRRGVVVQGPAVFVASDDPDDTVVSLAPTAPPAAPETRPEAADAGTAAAPTSAPPAASPRTAREGEERAQQERSLSLLVSRAIDYVAGYQQAFSAIVAEETYMQTAGGRRVSLVSDFLLVRPQNSKGWESFRDVFQVNGERVRDRDDRLKALFLDASNPDESTQLRAIKAESARYNIGPVERSLNVPLYALRVLTPEVRSRFRFTLGKTGESDGVPVQRIGFEEVARPTLVWDYMSQSDVPLRGSFAIDPLTGAVTESELEALNPQLTARYVVRYRRDGLLGLWVPREMAETYLSTTGSRLMEAQASYARLRRFQVKTEEKLAIPK